MSRKPIVLSAWFVLAMVVLFGLTTFSAPAKELAVPNDDIEVVRVFFDQPFEVFQLTGEFAIWEIDFQKNFFIVDVTAEERAYLEGLGLLVVRDEVLTAGVQQVRSGPLPEQGFDTIPGYPCYRTVEGTFATAESLAAANPDLVQWFDVGDSWEKTQNPAAGYDMQVLRLTNFNVGDPATKPKLYITSAIHAREYTTAELMTRFAEYLLDGYGTDADITWILDYHDIHLMLQSNPDGRKKAESGLLWRKNTNENYCGATSNSRGADLNRNFPFEWGCCGGSSGFSCSETYRGPSPASEPEVQAIIAHGDSILIDQRGPSLSDPAPSDATGLYIDVHSYSQLILWSWGFTSSPAPNGTALQTLGRKLAFSNGYFPQQAIGLYPTDGTTDDHFYGEYGVASYTYELGTSFFQNCGTFENTILPDNLPSLLYAAKVADLPYQLPAGPNVENMQAVPAAVAPGGLVTVQALVDDTRFNNSNGTEPTQNIAGAKLYIDVPPWEAGATGINMQAADGAFDEKSEIVTITGPATLSEGRHILYIQGQDTAGNVGAVSAAFVYIVDPATSPKIVGTVTEVNSGDPIAATVTAGNFSTQTNPVTGAYELLVVPGTYEVTASADTHGDTSAMVTIADGETVTQNFELSPECIIARDRVENGNVGWSADFPWAITSETAFSGSFSWTDSPGGDYANSRNVSLTSPTVNLTGFTNVSLSFAQICDTEAGYDYCHVEVSTNGGASWNEVALYDGNATTWEQIEIPVPALDNQSNVKVRFRLTSDFFITEDGWHLDDLTLKAAGTSCQQIPLDLSTFSAEILDN